MDDTQDNVDARAESQAERRIRDTFEQVRVWHRTPLFEPNVGAELRPDDEEWPYLATSQLSKSGLDVAAEHLFAVITLIDAQQVLPLAFRSILRTALVGSTQAVWLLAPDDRSERTKRLRTLVAEMYHRHEPYLDGLLTLNELMGEPPHRNTMKVRDHVRERAEQMRMLRTLAQERAKWNDTDAIEKAARAAFSTQANVEVLVQEALLEWKAGSGVSHGLVWPLLGSAGTRTTGPVDKHGRRVIEARGSLVRVENAYKLAYWMTDAGWKLLRRRGL